MAAEQRKDEHYEQARKLWTEFLQKYPLDARARGILYAFGQMNYAQEKWEAAIADWRKLVSKYPGDDEASKAQFRIAVTLETKLGKLEEALKEYEKVTWGPFQARAKARIAQLTTRSLSIATERVFRSGETPRINLTSRNVEEVTVQAYTVDLETYFRKTHQATDIGGLDIALIDADKKFTFKVPNYEKHKQFESQIELNLDGARVMAVTVTGKTLEATTLVVQSDLDMIVKDSRNEVFVFTENMKTGKAWPKVRLLVSNGEKIIGEGETNQDGVFQADYEELKSCDTVRVFAVAGKDVASNMLAVGGEAAAELEDLSFIYTDRPVYRAGQPVHVRGIIRRAVDDALKVEEGRKFTLDVYDNRNRLFWQKEVTLSRFGTFYAHLVLPPSASQGDYRVVARDIDEHTYQGSFQVREYRLEPVRLSIETDRTVFYRGEEISGKIVARYYYGAPLANRLVQYQLAGERLHEARTNDKGEVEFKLPTRDFSESQVLPLKVTLPERSLNVVRNFVLATQGFNIDVSVVRDTYLVGETFEVTVKTHDAEGQPVSRELTLKAMQRTVVGHVVGEREAASHKITTGKDGVARQTLKLADGGVYTLRVEGSDRFQNVIVGAAQVAISGDSDRVRLRILADQHTFNVGDTAQVQLHWRKAPALALVTFEGARVLRYQLVRLKTGANRLPIPLDTRLAPNFNLAVAVMTDARPKPEDSGPPPLRFHAASSEFFVERDLKVTLAARRKPAGQKAGAQGADAKQPIRPGDEIEVTVRTTDAQGNPVAAELGLAMVEQSLLDRFGENLASIVEVFQGLPREAAFNTASTITFAYRPTTHAIDPQLLKEEDRLALERDEALRRDMIQQGIAGVDGDRSGAYRLAAGDGLGDFDQARMPNGALFVEGMDLPQDLPLVVQEAENLYLLGGAAKSTAERRFWLFRWWRGPRRHGGHGHAQRSGECAASRTSAAPRRLFRSRRRFHVRKTTRRR